ncbi:MAG: heavy-metal-associated domain-containing protein [Geminicoccaceae bacterium]|nr:heavy-metal-associated domain-containing protein [Geminicoccaceae bacterium]
MREKIELEVEGMGCEGCVAAVEKALRSVPNVRAVTVDLKAGRAEVEHEGAELAALLRAVEKAGYQARPVRAAR